MSGLHSQAQVLHLSLQSTANSLSEKLELFRDNLQREREGFLADLSDVEEWLGEVYSALRREPTRGRVPSFPPGEVHTLKEEYSEEGVTATAASEPSSEELTLLEEVKREDGGFVVSLGIHRDVSISGSSFGSDLLDLGAGPDVMDTSVDVELEDEEYQKQVMERVMSGSDNSSPSPSPSPLERPTPLNTSGESRSDPFDDPVDPVGEQWAESMEDEEEEETDFQTETASVSSGSTLREGPDRSPDPRRAAAEFSEEEVNTEGVKDSGESEEEEGGGDEEGGEERRGMSLADELGELGIELEQEVGDKGVKSDEDPESEESGG